MTNTATALRSRIANLNAEQTDEQLLAGWITITRSQAETTRPAAARRTLAIAADSIEAELTSRGITTEQFNALFIATVGAV